jgi:ABC-type Co2+ transport system permease subunit
MSLQNKQTEIDETKPDRLAAAMLIIGIFIVCQYIVYNIVLNIAGGELLPAYILPFFFLGGIGIIYGSFRTLRGSSVTKQFVKAAIIKSWYGAIAGGVTTFVGMIIAYEIVGGGYWSVQFFFILIPLQLFFGISAGAISGLILGNKRKNNKAALVGGAIVGVITSSLFLRMLLKLSSLPILK